MALWMFRVNSAFWAIIKDFDWSINLAILCIIDNCDWLANVS